MTSKAPEWNDRRLPPRLWAKVARDGECWMWTGARVRGYGYFQLGVGKTIKVHRHVYECLVGPIPDQLNHLCRRPGCINPNHLEPVTNLEQQRRKATARTACKNGHPYVEGSYFMRTGARICRHCARANVQKSAQRPDFKAYRRDYMRLYQAERRLELKKLGGQDG
jgi:HNH endonuclease